MISASEDEEKNLFRYKMLENGQKSAVQGWLVEGKTWPPFQKIALRIQNYEMKKNPDKTHKNL
uniref:Uncharacterized protein n=1 Tax=Romanomermis culicivorax TaxID=13658 RepID=A0A915IKB5_ROMCU